LIQSARGVQVMGPMSTASAAQPDIKRVSTATKTRIFKKDQGFISEYGA